MAGDDEREAALRAEATGGPSGPTAPGERRQAAVRDDLSPGDRARRPEQLPLKQRQTVLVDRHVVVGDRRAGEVGREPPAQIRHEAVAHP